MTAGSLLKHPRPGRPGEAASRARARADRLPARAGRWMWANRAITIILLIWLVIALMAAFPQLFTSAPPNAQQLDAHLKQPGSAGHPLGTDQLGNDIYTQLVYGARTSVLVGLGTVLIGSSVGVLIALVSGYVRLARGPLDILVDVNMAFPGLLLALSLVVMIGYANVWLLSLILGATGWTAYTRVLTGVVRSLREREFILAARTSGTRQMVIIFGHILPNIMTTVRVLAVVDFSRAVLAEASLSFLGLGIQPPAVSWGLMLGQGQDYVYTAWWLVVFPGVAIAIVVLTFTVMATILQARADPARRLLRRRVRLTSASHREPSVS
jgi:peptide/nickel transport system permease protein